MFNLSVLLLLLHLVLCGVAAYPIHRLAGYRGCENLWSFNRIILYTILLTPFFPLLLVGLTPVSDDPGDGEAGGGHFE